MKYVRFNRSVYDEQGNMKRGLKCCRLEDIIPAEQRHRIEEITEKGVLDVWVEFRYHGRFTTCVITGMVNIHQTDEEGRSLYYEHMDVGNALLVEGDQPNEKLARALTQSRAVENFLQSLEVILADMKEQEQAKDDLQLKLEV